MQEKLIKALEAAVNTLPVKDQGFAKSLIHQFDTKGSLSTKQWYWVDKLAQPPEAKPARPDPVVVEVGDFDPVITLFKNAAQNLKWPVITVEVNGMPVSLKFCGKFSKNPNTVTITDGRPFGQNTWYGTVSAAGNWTVNTRAPEAGLQAVEEFLHKFAAAPAKTASEYGRLSGRCMFCNKGLTDEHSTAAGFGPVCAKNYGLEAQWKTASAVLEAA